MELKIHYNDLLKCGTQEIVFEGVKLKVIIRSSSNTDMGSELVVRYDLYPIANIIKVNERQSLVLKAGQDNKVVMCRITHGISSDSVGESEVIIPYECEGNQSIYRFSDEGR